MLFLPEGNLVGRYFLAHEYEKLISGFTAWIVKQDIRQYARQYEKKFQEFLAFCTLFGRNRFGKRTNEQLAEMIAMLHEKLILWSELQFEVFFPIEGLGSELEQRLSRFSWGGELLSAIAQSHKETKIMKARIELLRLVSRKNFHQGMLSGYARRYAWLPIYEFIDEPWDANDFFEQAREIADPQKELREYETCRKESAAAYRRLLKEIPNQSLKKKVEIMHAFSYLKEMRDDYRRKGYFLFRPFWEEIAKRLDLSFVETNYLLPSELIFSLRGEREVSRKDIKERTKRYALSLLGGKLEIYAGEEADRFTRRMLGVQAQKKECAGTPAFPGIVRGTVCVVYHQGEFLKFRSGQILVTAMTHPEFLPIMKKASAIVTDEGGITSHASITVRELKIPCIIGTKNATRVFKDGDRVEVDAVRGIMRRV